MDLVEIEYNGVEQKANYEELIKKVVEKCFEIENLISKKLYISITLTTPEKMKKINSEYRNIDKETDVLSFPIFEKNEIANISGENQDILGDIVISIKRVANQAKEYGHSFERELAYMVVHGFFHLLGYDHENEDDKKEMRAHEEKVLESLSILR